MYLTVFQVDDCLSASETERAEHYEWGPLSMDQEVKVWETVETLFGGKMDREYKVSGWSVCHTPANPAKDCWPKLKYRQMQL